MPQATGARKKALLGVSLTVNLGLLFSFKYYNLINSTFVAMMAGFGVDWPLPESNLLLPVGISFYTFQTIGYTVDVYRGTQAPERHLGRFALYVSYFPQLVAGPIERAHRLLPQLRQEHRFDTARVASGLRLMGWGMFKKVVVADRLAVVVDAIYSAPSDHSGPMVVLATCLFGYQVYCDFSGYSDIAIGAARVMGVKLSLNFDQPYLSRSITEFWRRWHISLMSWFRDYVYFPLGGSRHGEAIAMTNIVIVFALSGIWHGASWTFLAWGVLNGVLLVVDRATRDHREGWAQASGLAALPRVRRVWQSVSTVAMMWATWVFFRADNLDLALDAYAMVPHGWGLLFDPEAIHWALHAIRTDGWMLAYMIALCPLVEWLEWRIRTADQRPPLSAVARVGVDAALILSIVALGRFGRDAFVYFQF